MTWDMLTQYWVMAMTCVTAIVNPLVHYGQLITASVAACAICVAIYSVRAQRNIARKRAAIDFFLKTEMDHSVLTAYNDFRKGIKDLKNSGYNVDALYDKAEKKEYDAIRAYLNIHELVAVGIAQRVLDEKVCKAYWCDILTYGYEQALPVIKHARMTKGEGGPRTYVDLEKRYKKWSNG